MTDRHQGPRGPYDPALQSLATHGHDEQAAPPRTTADDGETIQHRLPPAQYGPGVQPPPPGARFDQTAPPPATSVIRTTEQPQPPPGPHFPGPQQQSPPPPGNQHTPLPRIALNPTDVVRPSRAMLFVIVVLPVGLALLKATTDFADGLAFLLALTAFCVAVITLYVMYVLRTSLGRIGNDLVFTDWLGRQRVVPLADIGHAAIIRLRAGQASTLPDKRLLLQRRSGAPPLVFRISLWKTDQIVGLLGALGIAVDAHQPMSAKQVAQAFPGTRFGWSDQHPVLLSLVMLLIIGAVIAAAAVIPDLTRRSNTSSNKSSADEAVANSVIFDGREIYKNSGKSPIVTCTGQSTSNMTIILGGDQPAGDVVYAYLVDYGDIDVFSVNLGYIDGDSWSSFMSSKKPHAEKRDKTYKLTGVAIGSKGQRIEKPFTVTVTCP